MFTKIAILSDTHGLLRPEVMPEISDCKTIIHAGDVGDPEILEKLRRIAPVYAVRGNMDKGEWAESLNFTELIEINGHLIYVLHEIERLDLDPCASNLSMVIFGHSHRAEMKKKDSVFYLNPGSAGPRRFVLPVTIAKVHVYPDVLIPEIIKIKD